MFDVSQIESILKNEATLWLGYSGGVDSHVLLDFLSKSTLKSQLQVVHINHALSLNADTWQAHCENVCHEKNIDFICEKIHWKIKPTRNVEQKSREARYRLYKKHVKKNDVLLLGHHQNDQAETLLLQLFRGSGIKGLSAMQTVSYHDGLNIIRPLLNTERDEIVQYANQNNLKWIFDESNNLEHFDRNYIRKTLMPIIQSRWPNISKTLSRTSNLCHEADDLLKKYARDYYQPTNQLDLKAIKFLEDSELTLIIREWLYSQGFMMPSKAQMQIIIKDLVHAGEEKQALFKSDNCCLRRFRDQLYAFAIDPMQERQAYTLSWDTQDDLLLPQLNINLFCVNRKGTGNVMVSSRKGGERIPFKNGHKSLKQCFQEWKIPYWERNQLPIIYQGSDIIAVGVIWQREGWEFAISSNLPEIA